MTSDSLTKLFQRPPEQQRIGPFRIDASKRLGQGGFAPVYVAEEIHAAQVFRTVALKVFQVDRSSRSESGNPTAGVARIVEEARSLCQVEHPNVVRYYSLVTDEELGLMGLAMEHLVGTPLSEKLSWGKLSVEETLRVGESVASALAAVHRAGLVHRDVKPANIVDAAGTIKLIDFGIVWHGGLRPLEPERQGPGKHAALVHDFVVEDYITRATSDTLGGTPGTMGYIDPACAGGSAPSPASDLYSLGVTLFECLTGRLPAAAALTDDLALERRAQIVDDILNGAAPAPPIASVLPDVAPDLGELIDALLSTDPAHRPASAEVVAYSLSRMRAQSRGHGRPLPPEEEGPFRGLERFEGTDRDLFFGRSVEIATAIDHLRTRGTLSLVGPSGSGKSSLARAGVVPAIERGSLGAWPPTWRVVVVTPGANPSQSLREALAKQLTDEPLPSSGEALADFLESFPQRKGEGLVLLVDQLEELVTLSVETDELTALLVAMGKRCLPGVRVIMAARRDLLDGLLALPNEFGRYLLRTMQLVAPLSDAAWADVLQQALSAYGYRFQDDALRVTVLEQLSGMSSAMPLAQFALKQLWDQRDRAKKQLTAASLRAIGGISGALQRHAEATFQQLVGAGHGDRARRIFLGLTTAQGTRSIRSHADLVKPDPEREGVLHVLEASRLVVEVPEGLTLAHEVLLSEWPRLRDWVEAVRADRVLSEEVERAASEWEKQQDPTLLWRGRRLSAARELLSSNAIEEPTSLRFLSACIGAERRKTYGRVAIGALVAGAIVLAATLYSRAISAQQQETLQAKREIVEQREQTDAAQQELEKTRTQAEAEQKKAEADKKDAAAALASADVRQKELEKVNTQIAEDKKAIQEKQQKQEKEAERLKAEAARVKAVCGFRD